MNRKLIYGVGIVLLLAILFGIFRVFKGKKEEKGFKEFSVRLGQVSEVITATGEIKAATGAQISLGARVTGMVVKEPISVGDHVKKGDLIAIIDNRELKEDVNRTEAELERVKVHFQKSIREQELAVRELLNQFKKAELEVKKASAEYEFRKWNYSSLKRLFESKNHSVSERSYREAKNALQQARAGLEQAKYGRNAAEAALNKARTALDRLKKEYKQELLKAEAEYKKAQIRFSYSILRAPFSGVITYVSTQEGETVVAGLNAPQFVKILDESRVENWIYVDETDIGRVKHGMEVTFHVDAYPDKPYHGKIDQIYPAPVVQNNVVYYIAVMKIYQKDATLHLKMTTHNKVHIRTIKDVLVVPNSAVKFLDGHYVVRLKGAPGDGFVKVVPGASDESFTEIKEGLHQGDVVLYRP
ncbi:MAG: HlyD family secretion protein [Thermodesulfobacteria bacterium]|nr:HlyD family secretion protein [Thermodesulfobacteriota bacterium]